MKNQMAIVVLDLEKHLRQWPLCIESISIKRKSLKNCLARDNNVILYAFHVTDFSSFPVKKKGIFSKEKKLWPKNVLWYSGGDIKNKKEYPGHVYKKIVPHGIGRDHDFFSAIRRLIKKIIQDGIAEKIISEKNISETVWNVLYPSNTHINDKQRADEIESRYLHKTKLWTWKIIDRANKFIEKENSKTFCDFKKSFDDKVLLEKGWNEFQDISTTLKSMGFDLKDYPVLMKLEVQYKILNNLYFPKNYPRKEDKRKNIIDKIKEVNNACQQIKKLAEGAATDGKIKKN